VFPEIGRNILWREPPSENLIQSATEQVAQVLAWGSGPARWPLDRRHGVELVINIGSAKSLHHNPAIASSCSRRGGFESPPAPFCYNIIPLMANEPDSRPCLLGVCLFG